MTLHDLFDTDPLTTSWLIALAALVVALVVVPLLRVAIAGAIYAFAVLTGRGHLRATAARVMPRIAHLIGGLVIGTAAVAAPAMASPEVNGALASIDLDRDAGASKAGTGTVGTGHTAAKPTADPTPAVDTPTTKERLEPAAASIGAVAPTEALYIVHTGDTLWDIAAAQMDEPTNAEITEAWKAIWRNNRAVIGDEPGLIRPGQQLDLGSLS